MNNKKITEYRRWCKKCGDLFYSYFKGAKHCPKCYKGNCAKKSFGELNNG